MNPNDKRRNRAAAQEELLSPLERPDVAPTDPISDAVAEIVQNVEDAFTGQEHEQEQEEEHYLTGRD